MRIGVVRDFSFCSPRRLKRCSKSHRQGTRVLQNHEAVRYNPNKIECESHSLAPVGARRYDWMAEAWRACFFFYGANEAKRPLHISISPSAMHCVSWYDLLETEGIFGTHIANLAPSDLPQNPLPTAATPPLYVSEQWCKSSMRSWRSQLRACQNGARWSNTGPDAAGLCDGILHTKDGSTSQTFAFARGE